MVDVCADIEMGRQVTGAQNPVVLYVSGGNTQVVTQLLTVLIKHYTWQLPCQTFGYLTS